MVKMIKNLVVALIVLSSLLTISAVHATWNYSSSPTQDPTKNLSCSIVDFGYSPEEVIPGGGEVEAPVGENHWALIQKILNEVSYGLNATKKPIIHNTLKNPGDVIYCDQTVQGGNLKHLMIEGSATTERLYFVLLKISDTEYHCFTLAAADLNGSIGSEIEVYKTVMAKGDNGVWTAPKSFHGYAQISSPGVVSRSINVNTWLSR